MAADYPNYPGWHDVAPDTSEKAAHEIAEPAATLRKRVRDLFARGWRGTSNEVAEQLGTSVLATQPRLSELRAAGDIYDTGERRRNDTGRSAAVWAIMPAEDLFDYQN